MASLQNSCTENGNISADINYLSTLEQIWHLTHFFLLLIFITKLSKRKGAGKNFRCPSLQVSLFCYEYFMFTIARYFSHSNTELIAIWSHICSS